MQQPVKQLWFETTVGVVASSVPVRIAARRYSSCIWECWNRSGHVWDCTFTSYCSYFTSFFFYHFISLLRCCHRISECSPLSEHRVTQVELLLSPSTSWVAGRFRDSSSDTVVKPKDIWAAAMIPFLCCPHTQLSRNWELRTPVNTPTYGRRPFFGDEREKDRYGQS